MIVVRRSLCWMTLPLMMLLCLAHASAQTSANHEGPATLELRRLVATNPDLKRLLVASIERAKQINPDKLTNPAQTLEQYYEFIAWTERALPSNLLEPRPTATL